jgi:hypothetical protein
MVTIFSMLLKIEKLMRAMFDLGIQQDDDDASGSQQQGNGLSRKESAGDLLLNLPRIASLPHFLFPMSEDSDSHVR